jgi:hypothetical protein
LFPKREDIKISELGFQFGSVISDANKNCKPKMLIFKPFCEGAAIRLDFRRKKRLFRLN